MLKELFPDVLYKSPEKQSPKWSEQEGLSVKRSVVRKEPTFFAFGLVDSQATGMHFDIHSFDDVVTQDSVTSDEMIQKTTERWQLSDNLGMMTAKGTRKKYAGTRYHYFDTYGHMIKIGIPHTVIAATDNGELDGNPIFLTREQLEQKKREQGTYMFSCQNLLKPVAKDDQKFNRDMIVYYKDTPKALNKYIAIDPANTKNKQSDYTAGLVFGYSADRKIYILDGVHDKLNLGERYRMARALNDKYKPIRLGYEIYGMQADISYFKMENDRDSYHMPLMNIKGRTSKEDRILRLVALFEQGDILFPEELMYFSTYHNKHINLVDRIIFEMEAFPFGEHDDILDCLARMFDLFLNNPSDKPATPVLPSDKWKVSTVFEKAMKQQQNKDGNKW
jgi:predicted phage terminase large subunit-like protein